MGNWHRWWWVSIKKHSIFGEGIPGFWRRRLFSFWCQRTKMRGIIPRVIGEAKPMRYEKFNLKGYVTEVHFSFKSLLRSLWWPCRPRWTMAVAVDNLRGAKRMRGHGWAAAKQTGGFSWFLFFASVFFKGWCESFGEFFRIKVDQFLFFRGLWIS